MIDANPSVDGIVPSEILQLSQGPDLTSKQRHDLEALIRKWSHVLARNKDDVGHTEAVQHKIHTGDVPPIRERFQPLPPMMYNEMKILLADMLNKGIIAERRSSTVQHLGQPQW